MARLQLGVLVGQIFCIFKPGARWFLEIALVFALVFVCVFVCLSVCVYPPLKALITSGIIWCDIYDWLNKFYNFFLLLVTLYDTYCRQNGWAWPY